MFRRLGIVTLIGALTLATTPSFACTGISLKAADDAAIRGRSRQSMRPRARPRSSRWKGRSNPSPTSPPVSWIPRRPIPRCRSRRHSGVSRNPPARSAKKKLDPGFRRDDAHQTNRIIRKMSAHNDETKGHVVERVLSYVLGDGKTKSDLGWPYAPNASTASRKALGGLNLSGQSVPRARKTEKVLPSVWRCCGYGELRTVQRMCTAFFWMAWRYLRFVRARGDLGKEFGAFKSGICLSGNPFSLQALFVCKGGSDDGYDIQRPGRSQLR